MFSEPARELNVMEWSVLKTFRSYHGRLKSKNQYTDLRLDDKQLSNIMLETDKGFFDTDLRQLLTHGEMDTVVENKLEEQPGDAQTHLQRLCSVLDRFVNTGLFQKGKVLRNKDNLCLYPKLETLLQVLAESRWSFELVMEAEHTLFRLDSRSVALEAGEAIRKFNEFFKQPVSVELKDGHLSYPSKTSMASLRGEDFRNRAVTGLTALFSCLSRDDPWECEGHRVLVKLPEWDHIDTHNSKTSPALDLFLSTCGEPCNWHPSHCDVRLSE